MQYIIADLEATCWKGHSDPSAMEIIEIGSVRLASSAGPVDGEFSRFVRPVVSLVLSAFCTDLTSIRQSDVDGADDFKAGFREFATLRG
jgi:inhibitor of KinA sporulation pathway (predicted exonuclease)